MAVAAPAVRPGSRERQIGDAALVVDRDHVPDVHAGTVLPALLGPGVVAEFAFARHSVEGPDQLAGAHIPGALVTGDAARFFRPRAAGQNQVLVDARRRGQGIVLVVTAHDLR